MVHSILSTPSVRDYFFFFNDTATTEIYTLSLHDALPISGAFVDGDFLTALLARSLLGKAARPAEAILYEDRKSTRLNSSHLVISYAVFCLKKKRFFVSIVCGAILGGGLAWLFS